MSKQCEALLKVWNDKKDLIMPEIRTQADAWLASIPMKETPHSMWDYYRTDGLWEPFTSVDNEYENLICYEGNADDEERLLVSIWIYVMVTTDDKYRPLIANLALTNIEGL